MVLVIGDIDGELLPERELAHHPGHWHLAPADGVIAAVKMPASAQPAVGRLDVVLVAEDAGVPHLSRLLAADVYLVRVGQHVFANVGDFLAVRSRAG